MKLINHGGPPDVYEWGVDACRQQLKEHKVSLSNMKAGEGGEFAQPEAGTQSAVCVRIVDIGTHQGQFGAKRKVRVYWELQQRIEDGGQYNGERFMQVATYTLSAHPKSSFIQMLEGWRGKHYEPHEDLNLKKILGQPCLLNLVQNEKGYINVASASRLPKGMEPLKPESDLIFLDLDDFDVTAYDKLPDKTKATIEESPEYKRAMGGGQFVAPEPVGVDTDDIPF